MLVRPSISKFISLFALAIMSLTALSACGSQNASTTNGQAPIKIGVSLPTSGDLSEDAKPVRQGYELWRDNVNKSGGLLGRQVQLDILSDNGSPDQVTTNYQKLITVDHVDLLFGSLTSPLIVPEATIAKRYNYALLEGIGSATSVFSQHLGNLFAVSLPVKQYLTSFGLYILSLPQEKRPKTVAYVGQDSPFPAQQIEAIKAQLSTSGVRTVLDQTYPAETTDYTPYAQQVIESKPDVVILGSNATPECTAFIKAFKQQNFNPSAFIAGTGPDAGKTFVDSIGGSRTAEGVFVPNGGWFPETKNFQNDSFTTSYVAAHGGQKADISSNVVEAYATGQVLEQAVKKINSVDNAKLIEELHKDTFNSLQGVVKFDADGQSTQAEAFLFQWQNNNLVVVYPSNQAQVNPEYPKPSWS